MAAVKSLYIIHLVIQDGAAQVSNYTKYGKCIIIIIIVIIIIITIIYYYCY